MLEAGFDFRVRTRINAGESKTWQGNVRQGNEFHSPDNHSSADPVVWEAARGDARLTKR